MALVNQAMERRLDLFRRAAAFRGKSRERLAAIGVACELFFQLYPDHMHIEHAIRITSVKEKASEQRRLCLETCEASCSQIVQGVIRDAVAAGDLAFAEEFGVEQLSFGLWSLNFGGQSIAASSPSLTNLGIREPFEAIRNNCNHLLDGVGWQPPAREMDLPGLFERVKKEVFAAEFAQLEREASS
jgi:hypothetical protein